MTKYSKLYLDKISGDPIFGTDEHKNIIEELLERAHNNEKLSIAESDFICRFMELAITVATNKKFNLEKFITCDDYIFEGLYLKYYNNLDGSKRAKDYDGPISIAQKQIDIENLNSYHHKWYPKLSKFNHKESLLNLTE